MSEDLLGQPLTPAEATVLRYLAEGYTIARIAQRQRTRPATVRSRATRARHKLGATTLDHAVQLHATRAAATSRPN